MSLLSRVVSLLALAAVAVGTATPAAEARTPVSGWFGWWASQASLSAIAEQAQEVDEANIFWWQFPGPEQPLCTFDNVDADRDGNAAECLAAGSVHPWTTSKLDAARATLQSRGVEVFATIVDSSNSGQLSSYLSERSQRRAYASLIARWAVKAGVDGVDLDWENFAFSDDAYTWAETEKRLTAFVRDLSQRLQRRGMLLSVTVPAGMRPLAADGTANPGAGYTAYNWAALARHADRLRIMAYDYSFAAAGPIAPRQWVDEVARSAALQLGAQRGKAWLGVPQYGRSWVVDRPGTGAGSKGCPADWRPSTTRAALSPAGARATAAQHSVPPVWDEEAGEETFEYTATIPGVSNGRAVTCEAAHRVWFAGSRAAALRARIAEAHGLGGIAVWNLATLDIGFFAALGSTHA